MIEQEKSIAKCKSSHERKRQVLFEGGCMIKDTLYAKYISERIGNEILENEFGFIQYKISKRECFISEMYIIEDKREKSKARELITRLSEIAKNSNCDFISANIHLWDKNASKTLIAALKIGFKIEHAEHGILTIILNLKGV